MRKMYIGGLLVALTASACTKNNDYIKDQLEQALPTIAITSIGLASQVNPFNATDVAQVSFGGSITKAEPGSIAAAWYTTAGRLVDSVYFDNWTKAASSQTKNNSVTTELAATTYGNTQSFSGNLNLQLRTLPVSATYSLRVYVRTKEEVMSTMSVSSLIRIK